MKVNQSSNSAINDRLNEYVDLDKYPIHELESDAGQALIAQSHEMMERDTLCLLDSFLRKSAVSVLSSEITKLETRAHRVNYRSTLYGWMNNSGFSSDHPRSQLLRRQCGVISTDLLDPEGPCNELYSFNALTEFVRRLLKYDTLYRSDCKSLSIQINVMDEKDTFGWHFDTNDGVVSFNIQNATVGGDFEYAPLIRNEGDENYDGVSRILNNIDRARQPLQTSGAFSLFMGRRSLHRVSAVTRAKQKRQSLLFSYDRNPGMVFPQETCKRLTSSSSKPYLGALTTEN